MEWEFPDGNGSINCIPTLTSSVLGVYIVGADVRVRRVGGMADVAQSPVPGRLHLVQCSEMLNSRDQVRLETRLLVSVWSVVSRVFVSIINAWACLWVKNVVSTSTWRP